LENGYFFDTLYEKAVPRAVSTFSSGLRLLELTFFNRLPYLFASGVLGIAHATQKYLDILVDELLYMVTHKTLASASKLRKVGSGSMEHYVAAAIIGVLIILILILMTFTVLK
jgi:hypothetical protein